MPALEFRLRGKQGQPPGSKLDKHEAFILGLVEEIPAALFARLQSDRIGGFQTQSLAPHGGSPDNL